MGTVAHLEPTNDLRSGQQTSKVFTTAGANPTHQRFGPLVHLCVFQSIRVCEAVKKQLSLSEIFMIVLLRVSENWKDNWERDTDAN